MYALIKKYLGWRNWAVFTYNSIFENGFVIFYITLRTQNYSTGFVVDILYFILFSIFSTTYGYLVNDFADIELDRRHGKKNTFSGDSKLRAGSVVLISLILSVLAAIPFIHNRYFLFLWLVWFLISTFYSLPPLRLKERGKTGLIFVVFAQRLLPILLVFAVFEFSAPFEIILLSVYVLLRGFSSDINHQIEDLDSDRKTATKTFAVEAGTQTVRRIFRINLELEKILLIAVLILFAVQLRHLPLILYIFLLLLALIYFAAYIYSLRLILSDKSTVEVNPFVRDKKTIFQFMHHAYPSVVLPLGLNIILIYFSGYYLIILGLQLILRKMYSINIIKESFIYKSIVKGLNK